MADKYSGEEKINTRLELYFVLGTVGFCILCLGVTVVAGSLRIIPLFFSTQSTTINTSPMVVPSDPATPTAIGTLPPTQGTLLSPSQIPAAGFTLLSITTSVETGENAQIVIKTEPLEGCTIFFRAPSGEISTSPELLPKLARDDGTCMWIWKIDNGMEQGIGKVTVIAGGRAQSYPIEIR